MAVSRSYVRRETDSVPSHVERYAEMKASQFRAN